MRIVTSNIKCNPRMRQRKVESDISKVSKLGDVIFWQEIEIPRYKRALVQHVRLNRPFKSQTWPDNYGLSQECPISFVGHDMAYWDVHGHAVRLMHHGRRLTTPNRYVSVVKATRPDGLKVAFMNTHYVSGAWNRKLKLHKQWRKKMWNLHHHLQKEWIHELLRDGYTVVGGGDFNRVDVPRFHHDQISLTPAGDIDHLFVIPAPGVHVSSRLVGKRHQGLFTDHPAVIGWVNLHQHAKVGAK